jgi:hypothetical protein
MLTSLIISVIFSCASDIAIITREEKNNSDTSSAIVDVDNFETTEPEDSVTSEPAEPGTEPVDSMTDLTIGFASLSLTQIACPACMGVTNEFDISASLILHQPTTGGYNEWITPVGSCVTQEIGSYVSSVPLDLTGPVSFNTIQLYPTGQSEWSTSNIYEYQIPRRTSVTVETESGTVSDAFETLEGFDSIEPYTLLWVDPSYAFEAVVSKQGTSFNWYPIITDAQFEIMVVVYTPDGSQLLGMVACMENDVGYMTIPGSYFQSYPYWSLAAVYLTRHRTERNPAPDFNGYIESHQTWTVLGTAHIE